MHLIPKNWADFQHYKDRAPPWIKLHKGLLDNYEFQCLPVASRALAPMLWLLASEHDEGLIDAAPQKLAFRLRMTEDEADKALQPLVAAGFFTERKQPASKALAKPKQPARTETEERREEKKGASAFVLPEWIPSEPWDGYVAMRAKIKKVMTDRARGMVIKELAKLRDQGQNVGAVLDRSTFKNWTDVYALKGGPTDDADPYGIKTAL